MNVDCMYDEMRYICDKIGVFQGSRKMMIDEGMTTLAGLFMKREELPKPNYRHILSSVY